MVLLHVQKGNNADHVFLYETKTDAVVQDVARELATIHNLRLRVQRLAFNVRQLAKYGPMNPEDKRGLSPEEIANGRDDSKVNPSADPTGYRVGDPPSPQLAQVLERTASEAEAAVSAKQAEHNKVLKADAILEAIQNVRGAATIAYPQGLPDYDTVTQGIHDTEDLKGKDASKDVVEPAQVVIWFAGKQWAAEDLLSKYVGKNEKVKIKVKIARVGQGAPQREPGVDEQTRKNMMAFYHKRQQEAKKAEEDDEDSFLNSAWANPKAFHREVSGVADIRFRPM